MVNEQLWIYQAIAPVAPRSKKIDNQNLMPAKECLAQIKWRHHHSYYITTKIFNNQNNKTENYRSETQTWSTYIWEYLSKLWAVRGTEPSRGSSPISWFSSPCLMSCEIGPEWNSEPVGLKSESIENLRIVFVIFNLLWK